MQQFLVSGVSWGVSRKLFEEFVPTIGQLIGSKSSGSAGTAYGQIAGAALGNLLGGIALGSTHYTAEYGAKKIRLAIGKGSEYTPKVSSEAMKQAIFIATFTTFMACKGMARSSLPKQENEEEDVALAYALDIAFSAFGGAAAEGITQLLAKGFGKISANWSWNEFKSRLIGGTAAGAASAMGDVSTAITKARSDLPGSSLAAAGIGGAMNSVMALGSWFLVRKVMNDHYAAKTSQSAAASGVTLPMPGRSAELGAVPNDPHALSPEEIVQLEQFVSSGAPLTAVSDSMLAVQMAEQLTQA
ncbi:putative type III effector [Collimonas pratensis]|uniref:Putative type III effector n=2 Tax=Collimonas pratensis TaxID=279113 RepID=A0A127QAE7_9BURK|nr:putative type III effector [Collimonas pratensis]